MQYLCLNFPVILEIAIFSLGVVVGVFLREFLTTIKYIIRR